MIVLPATKRFSFRIPGLTNVLLGTHLILLIAFDYLDETVRLTLAGALVLGYLWISLHATFIKRDKLAALLLFLAATIVFSWFIGALFSTGESTRHLVSFSTGLRYIAPFLAGIAITSSHTRTSPALLTTFCCVIVASAVANAIFDDYQFLNGTARWHPFSAGLHTSAYAVALVAILALELQRHDVIPRYFAVLITITCLAILLGYGVRTSIVFVAVYFLISWASSLTQRRLAGTASMGLIVSVALMATTSLAAFTLFAYDFETLSTASSGRLSNYLERMEFLADRGFWGLVVGHGPGSDIQATFTWRWGEKGSHSDFLRILGEGGLISLLAVFGYLMLLLRLSPSAMSAPILALIASSLVSNALLSRPNVAFLFFCIIALLMQRGTTEKSRKPS